MLKLLFWTASWWASRSSSYMLACICLQVTGAQPADRLQLSFLLQSGTPLPPRENTIVALRQQLPTASSRPHARLTISCGIGSSDCSWGVSSLTHFRPRPLHYPMTSRGRARGVILEALMLVSAELWIPPLKIILSASPHPVTTISLLHANSSNARAWFNPHARVVCMNLWSRARADTRPFDIHSAPRLLLLLPPDLLPFHPPTPNPWSLLSSAVVQNVLY